MSREPKHKVIVYAEPFAGRTQWDVERFLGTICGLYGRWPQLLVTDRGPGYRTIPVVLTQLKHRQMTRGIPNYVESLFTQLKRRIANFAGYFLKGSG